MDNNTPEEILLYQLSIGDRNAFHEIHEQYKKRVGTVAFHITKSKEDAEDILQEVFTTLWNERETLTIKSLWNYLFTVSKYKSIDLIDSRINKLRLLNEHMSDRPMEAAPKDNLDYKHLKYLEMLVLETKCSERDAAAYKYYHLYDMSYREIADKLGTSITNARSYVSKAKRELKKYFEKFR
jgi:RNA polymerase sigma-70 factor (ECF subfamily)